MRPLDSDNSDSDWSADDAPADDYDFENVNAEEDQEEEEEQEVEDGGSNEDLRRVNNHLLQQNMALRREIERLRRREAELFR